MQTKKTWKSVGAVLLTLAMLVGMLSVMGAMPAAAKTTSAMKFTADFSKLTDIVNAEAGEYASGYYRPAYASATDTSMDGQINAWAAGKLNFYTNKQYAKRAWMGQSSSTIQNFKDTWSGHSYFQIGQDGYLYSAMTAHGGQMMRRCDPMVVQYNGNDAVLKNFEAKVVFKKLNDNRGALAIAFHEDIPGYFPQQTDYIQNAGQAKVLVFGNGAGNYTVDKDGMVFYDTGVQISCNTIDDKVKTNDIAAAENGTRFAQNIALNADYTLTLRVVGTAVSYTLTDAEGTTVYESNQTCAAGDGYLSVIPCNKAWAFKSIEVSELDDSGDIVQFGTYTDTKAGTADGVERFTADFKNMADANYNAQNGLYFPDDDHNAEVFTDNVDNVSVDKGTSTAAINVADKALIDELSSKFTFYYSQEGGSFARPDVNGYVIGETSNAYITSKTGATGYRPDTGISNGAWTDGVGPYGNNANGVATWTLSSNRWLYATSHVGDGLFRKANSFTINDANGDKAVLNNFVLDMDFQLKADGGFDMANLAVLFHSKTPYIERNRTDGAMFAISPYGGYFFGSGSDYTVNETKGAYIFNKSNTGTAANTRYDPLSATTGSATSTTFTNEQTKNLLTNQRAAIYPYLMETGLGTSAYHLQLTVIGNSMTAVITDAEGNEKLNVTKSMNCGGAGYLTIGGSNAGANYGAMTVTRLNADGDPINFNDKTEGANFSANFQELAEFRNGTYYRNNGEKFRYLTNGNANFFTMEDTTYAADQEVVSYLKDHFEFYFAQEGTVYAMSEPTLSSEDIKPETYTLAVGKAARWNLGSGHYLAATFSGFCGGEILRKALCVAPKVNGQVLQTKNFETEFNFKIYSTEKSESGVILYYRSAEAGRISTGWNAAYDKTNCIMLMPNGIACYDNQRATYKYGSMSTDPNYTNWTNNALLSNGHASIKVVNDQLIVKITDSNTGEVMYEGTKTLARLDVGYLYFACANYNTGIGDIRLNVLDDSGEVAGDQNTTFGTGFMSSTVNNLLGYGTLTKEYSAWDSKTAAYVSKPYSNVDYPAADFGGEDAKNALLAEWDAYWDGKFDFYYNDDVTLIKNKNRGNTLGWGCNALYLNTYLQFDRKGFNLAGNSSLVTMSSMVPKDADGAQLLGKDCTADMSFRYDYGDAAGLFGFRMATAGRFVDNDGAPVTNGSFLKVSLTGVTLYDGGVEKSLATYDYSGTKPVLRLHVDVTGNQLTGTVYNESTKETTTFNSTLDYNEMGTFAQALGGNRIDFVPMVITVRNLPIAKVAEVAEGKLKVYRVTSDRAGYYKYAVTAVPDADCQLKIGTMTDTTHTLVPAERLGFRTNDDSNTFTFYAQGDVTFTAEFFTPHTVDEINADCIGTSYNNELSGLRFINRVYLYTANDKTYVNIDGKAKEVADYGMLISLADHLADRDLTVELSDTDQYVQKRSVPTVNRYYDTSAEFVDICVQITGLSIVPNKDVTTRAYIQFADGTVFYTTPATTNYVAAGGTVA